MFLAPVAPEVVDPCDPSDVTSEVVVSDVTSAKPLEGRAVRRSCRTDASLGGTGSTVAIANNNNDPAPKDLNSRILLSQSHSKKVLQYTVSISFV